uniref:Ig-like domain-containing protein n=1 Tax=Stegastes partitus TaxID=144197 RepID=A0A3B5ASW1_9TELE
CQFIDEHVSLNNESHVDTQLIHREAMLQFGQTGDSAVNPRAVTFLVTGSKLDLRRYMEGVEAEQLECEMRRYSTEGIHVRWPVQGAQGYNRWFSCTLRHSEGLFTVTGFLRHPSDQPPPGQQDYRRWPPIADGEILSTTGKLNTVPSIRLKQTCCLHCQFAIDHKGPNMTVEWHRQHRGERVKLFSHTSRSGRTEGTGVGLKDLAGGDASYNLQFTKMSSEATYICSVSVVPLFASVDVNLRIEGEEINRVRKKWQKILIVCPINKLNDCLCLTVFLTSVSLVAMVIKTQSPSVKASLRSQKKLHCQFAIDHKGPKVTVEWHQLHRGKKIKRFSYISDSGRTEGTGVGLKELSGGDASYNLRSTEMSSEGKYICSVSVMPLLADMQINLHITGEKFIILLFQIGGHKFLLSELRQVQHR